ncbi:RpiB Ribose 5-phosphate isomerase RpiB [Candidatus Nanopelagicaceae bacterium]|jgi:ribose 5-phosphate isomerase B
MLKLLMRIHIGSDHAGLEFKNELITHLVMNGHDVTDHGPYEYDALDDYPDFCIPCAEAVAKDSTSVGIVLGGSGNGEQISANKVKGIRAALVWSLETAKLAREHNNANVISVGQRQHTAQEVKDFIDLFLATKFPGDERHERRIQKISNYEITGDL